MNDLSLLHENVQAAVRPLGPRCKVHDHTQLSGAIKTPYDFAAALGYPVDRITKSVLLRSSDRHTYAVAVCSVDQRLNLGVTARAIGAQRVETASPGELLTKTGYPRNGVSPLGLPDGIRVIMDRALLSHPTILVGGGAAAVEIELPPPDLVRASGAAVEDISEQRE